MQKIKILLPLVLFCLFFGAGRANAQWTVIDPSNIAQSIVNSSKSLVQESTTATNMVRNFQSEYFTNSFVKFFFNPANNFFIRQLTPFQYSPPNHLYNHP